MPRPLVVGNGRLLINFDQHLNMRDLYYPYVGQLNHIGGHHCKLGVWVNGRFSWCDQHTWEIQTGYKPETLVTDIIATNRSLGIQLHINDGVHQRENIYLKRLKVMNLVEEEREIRIFFNHDISISESEVGDTAVFDPFLQAIYHYKRNVYLLMNGQFIKEGMFQYSLGIKRFNHAEGTWRDAEDGSLDGNPIAQGSVDSTLSLRAVIKGKSEQTAYYWICVGKNYAEIKKLNQYVLDSSPERLLNRVEVYWNRWVNKSETDFATLPESVIKLYKLSLLIVRTQTDQHGAIVAANDSDILQYNRDHYSYMWPRDGALVALAMSKAGYAGMVGPFFQFCADALTKDGYLLHKYNPDGSLGSSWHPYYRDGETHLPIQEDETALVLFALWKHYAQHKQVEFCQSLYASLIRPAAKFLIQYVDEELWLPKPSYDLWEERRGIFTFTCSTVFGGLMAAANFARLFGDDDRCQKYFEVAMRIRDGIITHLYDKELHRFIRGIYRDHNGRIQKDITIESSVFALSSFGVLPADDPKIISTMEATQKALQVETEVGGTARYQNDYYFQRSQDIELVPGNPWIICTLWMAEWQIARAITIEQLHRPLETLEWVVRHAMESGVLPEQLDPYSGKPLSVAPLTWSHSTYVLTVLNYIEKYKKLKCMEQLPEDIKSSTPDNKR